jgi:predicted dehydrogenase
VTIRARVAVIGTGFAASAHLDALSRVPGVELTGVLGSSPERTRAAAERLGVERAFGSLDEALAEAEVVHNCTPNDAHGAVTIAALGAGLHVVSEKPLGLDGAEARRMTELAAGTDVVTTVCFVYRHFPLVQQMREFVGQGSDGPVHLVHGAYLQDWLLRADDWNWRLERARAGASRAVGDIGSHWIDLAQHVTGQTITSVMAQLGRVHDERVRPPEGERETFVAASGDGERVRVDTEDIASVLFRLSSGAHGTVTISQVSAGWKNHLVLEVDAAEASFVWDQEQPNQLWIGRRDGANRVLVRDPSLLAPSAARLAHFPGGHQEGWPDALRNLFDDFYGAVRARRRGDPYEPTFASFEEAARVQVTVEAILRSDATKTWIDVDDVMKEVAT